MTLPVALTLSSGVERMFPTLTPAQVKRIAVHGQVRSIRPGEVLVEAGEQVVPFFVVTAGRIEIVRPSGTAETLVAVHGPGQFTGEVNMLSGRPALVRARASGSGEVIELDHEHLLALVQTDSELSELIMLVRGNGLAESMSRYLIRRIEQNPAIVLRTKTEIVALEGSNHLERVRWRDAGSTETRDIKHVFVMTGAVPSTQWLDGCVALDAKGFIKTGPDLSPEDLAAARWPLARPLHLLETSLPGVFAVGDVRGGNIKRVASAVGEGSIAISFVHQVLSE